MFLITLLQILACLPYVSLFACFTHECVNSALAVVFSFVVVPGFGNLKYSVLVFECYVEVFFFLLTTKRFTINVTRSFK